MRGGVAGVGADGLLQHLGCLAVLSPEGINDRQIVIGLGQRGMVLGQRGKQPDGLIVFFCSAAITACRNRNCTSLLSFLSWACTRWAAALSCPFSINCCTSSTAAGLACAPPWLSSEAHMTAATDIGRSHAQRTRGLPSKGRTKARNMDALSKDGVDRRLALSLVRQMLTKTRIL